LDRLFTAEDIRKYFYASCFLAIVCLLAIIYLVGTSGLGNVLMEGTAQGSGTSDFDLQGTGQDARVAAYKSIGVDEQYKFVQTRGTEYSASTSLLDVEISIEKAGGTQKTMYVYRQKNKDAGEVIRINNVVGPFVADSHGTLTVSEDGALSYDLTYEFSGENLSYDAQAIIMDAATGRPATNLRIQRVGNWTIWNHLNVTTPIVEPDNWLGACEGLNNDIINDPTIPDSIFVMPWNDSMYNYYAVGKKIFRQLNTSEQE
jgi:hypothetical protein